MLVYYLTVYRLEIRDSSHWTKTEVWIGLCAGCVSSGITRRESVSLPLPHSLTHGPLFSLF